MGCRGRAWKGRLMSNRTRLIAGVFVAAAVAVPLYAAAASTDNARVTCTGVVDPNNPADSQCNRWSITPTGANGGVDPATGQVRNVARLVRLSTTKGKTTEQKLGDYYMTFNIGAANP